MKKLIIVVCLCSFFLTGCFSQTNISDLEIVEEAEPIRKTDKIIGMNYYITLSKNFSDTNISTHIIDSIFHYKSIDDIDVFFVSVILDNQSSFDYQLDQVFIRKGNIIMNRYSYDIHFFKKQTNTFSFSLRKPLSEDCVVELKLIK